MRFVIAAIFVATISTNATSRQCVAPLVIEKQRLLQSMLACAHDGKLICITDGNEDWHCFSCVEQWREFCDTEDGKGRCEDLEFVR